MSQECGIGRLLCNNILKLMDTSGETTQKCESSTITIEDITEQVSKITQTQITEKLSLSANELRFLPNGFTEHLANLISLDLSDNRINNLPESLIVLKKLVYLNVDCNRFLCIPSVVCKLSSLQTLKARENLIKEVPDELANLTNLKDLDLTSNRLNNLCNSFANLHRLQNLYLANNTFKKIPDCVANGMSSLQTFDFSQNSSAELNISPRSTKLTVFRAERNNKCPSFPRWILCSKYSNLEEVSLNKTYFKVFDLPEELSKSRIRKLCMGQCKLSDAIVERIVAGMTNLEELIIGNSDTYYENNFWCIPIKSLKRSASVKLIDVSNTGMPAVLKTINDFVNLSVLDVSSNTINWLPEEICSLRNLTSLMVQRNRLAFLPKRMGELVSLAELRASDNVLCKLPVTMRLLINLRYLDLYNNEFESLPEAVAGLPSLMGLDLEKNCFSTERLLLGRDVHYENMRDVLRDHWRANDRKLDGWKLMSPEDFETRSKDGSSSSVMSNSTSDRSLEGGGGVCSFPEGIYNEAPSERWDSSEDSADEFDPTECKEPRQRTYSPFTFYRLSQRVFCPAKMHETRVITRVAEMLQNGSLVWPTQYEEGQFEDP